MPLTVTDRHLAEPPAFGVALAHVWPSAQPPLQIALAIDAARRAAAALGIANGPDVHAGARLGGGRVRRSSWRLGSAAATTPSCAGRRSGVDLNALALAVALGEPLRRQRVAPQARGGRRVHPLPRPARRGAPRGRQGSTRRRRSTASWIRVYRRAGRGASGRCGAVPTGRARSSRSGRRPRRRSRGLAARRTPYASRCRCRTAVVA